MKKTKLYVAGAAALVVSGVLLIAPLSGASAATPAAKPQPQLQAAPRTQVSGTAVSVAPNTNGIASVSCPAGTIVTGGGGQTSGIDIFFTDSFASGNGWTIRGTNKGTFAQSLTPIAICIG